MKRINSLISIVLAVVLMASLCACGSGSNEAPVQSSEQSVTESQSAEVSSETAESSEQDSVDTASAGSKTLVIYFSRTGEQYQVGVIDKGNIAIVAEMIAEKTGADIFEIIPADDHYPMTYNELTDVAKQEQRDNARPAYSGELPDLSQYDTVFIGAPVWWGDWPMIMYTVFENNDFSGKNLVPFSTHEGSGLSGFDRKLQSALPDSTVLEGLAIRGSDAQNKQNSVSDSVDSWLSGLGF